MEGEAKESGDGAGKIIADLAAAGRLLVEEEGDQDSVTVREVGGDGGVKIRSLHLHDFCVLCLRRTGYQEEEKKIVKRKRGRPKKTEGEEGDKVPSAEIAPGDRPGLLATLNWTWGALGKKSGGKGGAGVFEPEKEERDTPDKVLRFNRIPKMCLECADKLVGIDKLLSRVRTEIRELREVIAGWEEQGRLPHLRKSLLKLGVGGKNVGSTVEFLKSFRDKIVTQGESVLLMQESDQAEEETEAISRNFYDCFVKLEKEDVVEYYRYDLDNYVADDSIEQSDLNDLDKKVGNVDNVDPTDNDPDYLDSGGEEGGLNSGNCSEDEDYIPQNKKIKKTSGSRKKSTKAKPKSVKQRKSVQMKKTQPEPASNCDNLEITDALTDEEKVKLELKRARLEKRKAKAESWEKEKITCNRCGKIVCRKAYKRHLRTVHSLKVKKGPLEVEDGFSTAHQICDLCNEKILRIQILEHLKEHVGEEYIIRCPNTVNCSFVCCTLGKLQMHVLAKENVCLNKAGQEREAFKKSIRTCDQCNFVGTNLVSLRTHLLRDHPAPAPEQTFTCPVSTCPRKFNSRQGVVLHLGHHDIPKQFDSQPCVDCEGTEIDLEEMKKHLEEEHQAKEIIKCRQCPFQFLSWEHLVNHMYEHRYGELSCDICGDAAGKFSRHAGLVDHYFTMHQIGKPYLCEHCSKSFLKLNVLTAHVQKEHLAKPLPAPASRPTFECELCGKMLKSIDGMRTHKIKEHGAEPYKCQYCNATFTRKGAKCEHERIVHKGVKPEVFPCLQPNCGVVCRTRFLLNLHHSTVHLGEPGKYVCDFCGKLFTTCGEMGRHRKRVHLKIKKCVCETCGGAFACPDLLRRHRVVHTGERPYACDQCGQRFRQQNVLRAHLKSHLEKGAAFKPNGPMKHPRKSVQRNREMDDGLKMVGFEEWEASAQ